MRIKTASLPEVEDEYLTKEKFQMSVLLHAGASSRFSRAFLSAYLSELSPRLSRHAPLLYAYGINSNESIEMLLSWSNESFQTFFKFDTEPVKRLMIVDRVEGPLGSGYLERMGHFDVVLLEHQFTERRAQLAKARAEARKAVHGNPVIQTEDL
jgi:hypothetical protein